MEVCQELGGLILIPCKTVGSTMRDGSLHCQVQWRFYLVTSQGHWLIRFLYLRKFTLILHDTNNEHILIFIWELTIAWALSTKASRNTNPDGSLAYTFGSNKAVWMQGYGGLRNSDHYWAVQCLGWLCTGHSLHVATNWHSKWNSPDLTCAKYKINTCWISRLLYKNIEIICGFYFYWTAM